MFIYLSAHLPKFLIMTKFMKLTHFPQRCLSVQVQKIALKIQQFHSKSSTKDKSPPQKLEEDLRRGLYPLVNTKKKKTSRESRKAAPRTFHRLSRCKVVNRPGVAGAVH